MLSAAEAKGVLRSRLSHMTQEDYLRAVHQHDPDLLQGSLEVREDASLARVGLPGLESVDKPVLFDLHPEPRRPPLSAYLASALTGLGSHERRYIFQLSDVIAAACEQLDIALYEPRKNTDPVHHPDVSDTDVFHIDRERVVRSDLLVYLAHYPSTGAGEELDFAYNAMVPILVISHSDVPVSRMVTGIPGTVVSLSYEEPEELRARLRSTLEQMRPQLVQRKVTFGDYDINIVGDRVRQLREAQGLTRADVAQVSTTAFPLSVEMLARLEESTDREANPSLIHLREIATALGTTVADLVEPDMSDVVISSLESWVSDRQAARFGKMSTKDRNRLLRRLLLRVLDSLESDE